MLRVLGATDKGRVRDHNEDRFAGELLAEDYAYGVVCDGMGGENGGSVASGIACEEVRRLLESAYRPGLDEKSIYMILESAVSTANAMVYAQAQNDPENLKGMGTTLCLAIVAGDRCYTASVGDSRAYLYRAGCLIKLTTDHTRVQTLVDQGLITPDEALVHRDRNLLTRAIGVQGQVTAGYGEFDLLPGDSLLLCSDGLYSMMEPRALEGLMGQAVRQWDAGLLIQEANVLGGRDNITAVLLHRE